MPIITGTQSQTREFQDRYPTFQLEIRAIHVSVQYFIKHGSDMFLPGDYLKDRWCSAGFILTVKQTQSFTYWLTHALTTAALMKNTYIYSFMAESGKNIVRFMFGIEACYLYYYIHSLCGRLA